ncbi:MAG: hypothetical protein EBR82_53185 [Caulobacteraceae bacterium]|nr:hypothetical protein [Caulobacteraceae bacterium]NDC95751.1 hypothetical protein [bacterium]NDD85419.1 hypothetical protein [bacterium]NDG31459.1 hypothetical protein [bacterium]
MTSKKDIETMVYITDVVTNYIGIPKEFLFEKSKKRTIVTPRTLCMAFSREYTRATLKDIAKFYNKKDHSTVIHAIDNHRYLLDYDRKYSEICENLKELFNKNLQKKTRMAEAYTLKKGDKFFGIFNQYKKAVKIAEEILAEVVEINPINIHERESSR